MVQYEKSLGEDSPNLRLVESVEKNAHHYIDLFSRAVDKVMPEPTSEPTYDSPEALVNALLTLAQLQGRRSRHYHDPAREA